MDKLDDKLYFSMDAKNEDFEYFKECCEFMESLGYRLNISECCYER